MKHINHPGEIYDTFFYGVVDFNKSTVEDTYKKLGLNYDNAFGFYHEVKNNCKPLNPRVFPFFYFDGSKSSVLISYLRRKLNFHEHTFDDIIKIIKNDKKFKEHTFKILFANLHKSDIQNLIAKDSRTVDIVLQNQSWDADMSKQVSFLVHHFPYALDILIDTLKEINKNTVVLRTRYEHIIEQRTQETCEDKEILLLFEKYYSLSKGKANKTYFSLSFMSQFVIWSFNGDNQEPAFFLGNRYKEFFLTKNNDSPTTAEKMFYVLGDSSKYNIVLLLNQHKVLTMSEISRLAHVSPPQAFNIINFFLDNLVVREHHREGRKIFFALNNNFITSSQENVNDFIDIFKPKEEGAENDGQDGEQKQ